MIIKELRGHRPQFGRDCFVADNAVVIGDVVLGDHCSVWYNAVIRADVNAIRIGDQVNIQDGAVVHCTHRKAATSIGHQVTIGHNAVVHGCTLHDRVLVGMGAVVMDGVVVESDTIIAAGAVITEGSRLEGGAVYAGVPARKVKVLDRSQTAEELARIAGNYLEYSRWHQREK